MKQYTDKMDKVLEQVRVLIARADHPNTPPAEAATARERADILMFRYKIDSLTAAEGEGVGIEPVWATIPVSNAHSEFSRYYLGILREIASHCDLRMEYDSKWYLQEGDDTERLWWVAQVVGYESDVAYAQMLWLASQLAFGKTLEPKFDHDETHQQNALRLRRGGMERHRIAQVLFGDQKEPDNVNEFKARNRAVTRMIKAEAARLGQPELAEQVLGRGNNIGTFRDSYASGFYSTLVRRLRLAATARGQFSDGTLVLANAKERINEAFYERFPHLRPQPVGTPVLGETQEECPRCKKAKSGYCREHSWKRPSRAQSRPGAFNADAFSVGSAAARTVDLGGPTPRVGG